MGFELDNIERRNIGAEDIYDMIVIGGGPGGYTAALYATRAGMKTVVLEKLSAGGQMALTQQIDNYPGFEEGIDGFSLGEKMRQSAERFGAISKRNEVVLADLLPQRKRIETDEETLYGKTVVLATGANPRELGVANEKELVGRGVSYCAFCDGMFYRDKTVVVVGGGNSAAEDALILSNICKKVKLVHRRDAMRAARLYQDAMMQRENIEFYWNSIVEEVLAEERVTGVQLHNRKEDKRERLACDGVFISIGRTPNTALFQEQVSMDDAGYIIADESTQTNIPGVFAVGDVRTKALRQIVTATADGAVAVHYAEKFLADTK